MNTNTKIRENNADKGDVHSIGNGEMLIYHIGPDIINFYGPPYSSASFLRMNIGRGNNIKTVSERNYGTAIWTHKIFADGCQTGQITDYILPDRNIYIRKFKLDTPIKFSIDNTGGIFNLKKYFGKSDSLMIRIPIGAPFFAGAVTNHEQNLVITYRGDISFEDEKTIVVNEGESELIFSSCKMYPDAVQTVRNYLSEESEENFENVKKYWDKFSAKRHDFEKIIPDSHSLKKQMLFAIDSISVLNKTQQSSSGAFAAGHYYPMGYIRDQAGVVRCMLELGYIEEAKGVLDFWWNKFKIFGELYNAEGMDNDNSRLLFINDEVENTGYLLMCYFKYFEHTEDKELIQTVFPLLKWAFEIQLPHIAGDMLEFSCDETYIAGGTFPKNSMYHGSAEATLLFIEGGERFLNYARIENLLPEEKIADYSDIVSNVRRNFKKNFFDDGILYANNPRREDIAGRPQFRHGFCDAEEILDKHLTLSWTEKNEKNYFVCPKCRDRNMPEMTNCDKRYILNSVNLALKYHNTTLFTDEEIQKIIDNCITAFETTNSVPSNPGSNRSLGYDYGLMLYNAAKLNLSIKNDVLKKTLELLDSSGAWVEYYDNDIPFNCRCRTWESSINIEGIIEYIRNII